jgi:hypothetical protein
MNDLIAYEILKAIGYKGDRIEKGSIVHMTASEAENIGEEYLKLADADDKEVPAEPTEPDAEPADKENPEDEKTDVPDEEKTETQTDDNQDKTI